MDGHLQTPQDALRLLAEAAASGSNQGETFVAYEKLLGLELNPYNVVMLKTIPIAFILQFILFYSTWYFAPSLTTNRRGLAWTPSFYCACFLCFLSLSQLGQLRVTIFDHLGLDSTSLGLPPSATIFSHWTPALHRWVMELGISTNGDPSPFVSSWIGDALRCFVAQPLFSLAPLRAVANASADLPFLLGGGGRLLVSLENFQKDTMIASVIAGYFVGYALSDEVLSFAHYREHVGLLTGDIHHVFYTVVVYSMCRAGAIPVFGILAGLSEASTMILCWGYMFPKMKSDFWFSILFFLTRILLNIGGLHELAFNMGPTGGGAYVYTVSLVLHAFWFSKFLRIQRYKAQKRAKERLEQAEKRQQEIDPRSLSQFGSAETSGRVKAENASVIQLRATAGKKSQ